MGIRGQTNSVGVEFSDIWDNLQGVVTLRFNGLYKNKFGFIFDYNYLDLSTEIVSGMEDVQVGFKSQIINLGGFYRFIDGPHNLDGDKDWVDPIVGLRYNYKIADQWSLSLYGDIGGFGVSSDFTWQGFGLIDFQPWKNVAFIAGYRAIGTDYETGSGTNKFSFDVTVHGPIIGVEIRW